MPETIGQQLKQARIARYLKVGDVAQATHIQARFIEAMEADDFESLPSPVQARAFLRIYAGFLELSLDELISRQHTSIEKPLTEDPIRLPLPGQSQAPPEISGGPDAFVPTGEPLMDKPPTLSLENSTGLLARIRQSLSQQKKSSGAFESTEQTPPPTPRPQTGWEVKPAVTEAVKPVPEKAEEASSPGRIERPSQVVFSNIGKALQNRREALSLSLDEIEQHIHVRKHYLQALEEGNFDHMPSSVQMRGMLNNYARFLDMDVEAILLQFAEGLQTQRLERQPAAVEKAQKVLLAPSPKQNEYHGWRRYLSMDVIIGVGLVVVLLAFAVWGTSRIIGLRAATTPQPTAESISEILAASTEPITLTPTAANETNAGTGIPAISSTPIVTAPAAGQGPVQVVVVALEEAFVRVTVDGKQLFNGRVTAGTAYPFDGNNQIEVLTGNGAAISILFKQSDLGPMGTLGQVVDRIYTANAILNPTATATPTPTTTPIHSLTPTPSSTSQSSRTPTAHSTTQGG